MLTASWQSRGLARNRTFTAMLLVSLAAFLSAIAMGCAMAAAPQPPSLHLPKPIRDLKAQRTGDQVQLTWTMPKQTTDHQKITASIPVRICLQTTTRECDTVANLHGTPGKPATFIHALPSPLTSGPLRTITYQAFAQNSQAQAADASNDAITLAGIAPLPVVSLTAQVVPQGVVLHWQPASQLDDRVVFRIERTLLSAPVPAPAPASAPASLASKNSAITQTLIVQPHTLDRGIALDSTVQSNLTYRYTVARVLEYQSGAVKISLSGLPSPPITIFTQDTFPPAAPQRLVAVVISAGMNGAPASVDLSWSASSEPDFSQYRVDRRELSAAGSAIAPATQLAPLPNAASASILVTPTFHDATVLPGHRYAYSVSAVDASGNMSPPSPQATVQIPALSSASNP